MHELVRVLIVDDEEPVRKNVKRGFDTSCRYKYEVTCVESPEECAELKASHKSTFDVCIIDLGFGSENRELVGYKMLIGLACVRSRGIAVVYSGHPSVPNVVRAMQLGATDFVFKADCPPHKLAEHVETLLSERRTQEDRWQLINEYLKQQNEELCQQYAGRVLAIVVEEAGPAVVTTGESRLDALLKYAAKRSNGAHPQWPVDPHLHIVPPAAKPPGAADE